MANWTTRIKINEKLATGKFTDTGEKYHPIQAKIDASNPKLRQTAKVEDGKLSWRK